MAQVYGSRKAVNDVGAPKKVLPEGRSHRVRSSADAAKVQRDYDAIRAGARPLPAKEEPVLEPRKPRRSLREPTVMEEDEEEVERLRRRRQRREERRELEQQMVYKDAERSHSADARRSRPSSRNSSLDVFHEATEQHPRARQSRAPRRSAMPVSTPGAAGLMENASVCDRESTIADDVTLAAQDPPQSNRHRKLASVPQGQVNLMKEGRLFSMNGIDNLTLLMEDDAYQPVCYSIYMFKTELDYLTVRDFFEVLAQLYPKYRYVVDFNPYAATGRDRKKRKEHARLFGATEEEKQAHREEHSEAARSGRIPFNSGPRNWYSKSLKAGSWFRPAQWRIDDDFHVSENINVLNCGGDSSDDVLFDIAGRFLSRHFNFNKPIWEALLVRGLNTVEGAKSALMIKIHHCFSDGQGMIQSYHAALTAMSKNVGIKEVQQWVDVAMRKKEAGQNRIKPTMGGTLSHICYVTRELYFRRRKTFLYRDPKQRRVTGRLYYHSDGIPMKDIALIRDAFPLANMHLTVNDVAVALLARAMQVTAIKMGSQSKADSRAALFVPVSRRPIGDWELFNYTTGAMAWVPYPDLDKTSIEEQLLHVNKEMKRMKRSYLPSIWYNLFYTYCKARVLFLPNYPGWRQLFFRAFSEYHVATNVPGPTEPVSFGKHEAYSYHVLPPSSPGKATMAIGMISYASLFSLAVSCDNVPEFKQLPLLLCESFQESAAAMIQAAKEKLGRV
ncbi:hypothetical protein MVES1_000364 [Malassezia vespertilionis]|uniref:Uncharacterized protein n=1 Tax=Malassezia vespertilionis TaxID=2020962 RepID=A0A2N1JHA6_9BASI|nr:uncharacterized protein MVES1_000364 [Malassezia vespertilionis]PKI85922.1 hypothetical protein MVES_000343 [Malassezia vespertilionis]WFD05039.1 hypothetical protein MVES1_000364 [Malassezia vespertilionis]